MVWRPVLGLSCALMLAAASPVRAQGTSLDKVVRWWSFFKLVPGATGQERIGPEHVQVGGEVDETHDFGPLVFVPPGQLPRAEGRVYSSETGGTYWVSTQAPDGVLSRGDPIGSKTELKQYQYFTKTQENAQLRLEITDVTLEGIDDNGVIPSDEECPWREPGTSYLACRRIMVASVHVDVTAFSIFDQKKFLDTGGFAEIMGFRGFWDRAVRTDFYGTLPFWNEGQFEFDEDVAANGGGHVRLTLKAPITIDVPLSSVGVGNSFYLSVTASASTYNRRQRESYLGAKFRDPMNIGAVEFSYSGLLAIDTPTEHPPVVPPTPEPPCPGPARRAAGKLQFEASAYEAPELPGLGAAVVVTRSGGRRGAVSARFTTTDGTAVAGTDYTALSTSVLFADGEEGSRVVRIPILLDGVAESNKTVDLTLSDPGGCASLGRRTTAVLTIQDDDRPIVEPPTYTVGGTVTGLVGAGLVLYEAVTGNEARPVTDGAFAFPYPFSSGDSYNVRLESHPDDPAQVCTLTNGTGTVGDEDVTGVSVNCVTPPPNAALDPGFGGDGKVTLDTLSSASAIAVQPDGKIVVVGRMTLARYLPEGTLDPTFGNGGVVTIVFNGGVLDAAQAVALQPDGKILVAGFTRTATRDDFALARYNADGSPDTGFGTNGHVNTDFAGFTDKAWAVLVQADGGIVLAGHAATATPLGPDNDFAVARYTSAGALDTGFGTGGKALTNIGGRTDLGYAAVLQPDGKIVLAGRVADGGADDPDVGLVRYEIDGTPDTSFDGNGIVQVDLSFGDWDEASDVALQADGKIVVAIQALVGGSFQFEVARFDAGGSLDLTFGSAGVATTSFSTLNDFARAVAVQADGRIVLAGQSSNLSNPDVAVARFTADGSPDATFDGDGKVTVDFFGARDGGECVAVQPDGKVLVGGFATDGTSNTMMLVRLVP